MMDRPVWIIPTPDLRCGREAALRWAASQIREGRNVIYLAIDPPPTEILELWRKMFPQMDPPQVVDAEGVRFRSERDLQAWINLPVSYVVDFLNRAVPTLWKEFDILNNRQMNAYVRFLDLLIARVRRSNSRVALILLCEESQYRKVPLPGHPHNQFIWIAPA